MNRNDVGQTFLSAGCQTFQSGGDGRLESRPNRQAGKPALQPVQGRNARMFSGILSSLILREERENECAVIRFRKTRL